jgi:O-antigen/teichoic acid export membrane protein
MDQLLSATMLAARAQAHDLRAMTVGLVTLLALLWALGLWLGPVGAAWAVVAGLALRLVWRLMWAQGELALPGLLNQALRAAIAAAAGVAVFMALQAAQGGAGGAGLWSTLLALLGGGLTHAVVAVVSGAFGAQHRADWSAWRHKAKRPPEALA